MLLEDKNRRRFQQLLKYHFRMKATAPVDQARAALLDCLKANFLKQQVIEPTWQEKLGVR